MKPLGVTGSTGRVGGRVAARLSAAGLPLRLLCRDTSRAPEFPQTEAAHADYGDQESVTAALSGLETVFMVSGAEEADRVSKHRAFVDGATAAGVKHVVYTSFFGAAHNATFTLARDHFATEEMIKSAGLIFTFLRDNLYADFVPFLAGEDGVIKGPAGSGRAAMVAIDDIAEVAATVLQHPEDHRDRTYDLTGPESLTLQEVAAIASKSLQRPIKFVNETIEEAYQSRAHHRAPHWQVDAWVSTYTAIAAGELDGPSAWVERIIGRRPLMLAEVLT